MGIWWWILLEIGKRRKVDVVLIAFRDLTMRAIKMRSIMDALFYALGAMASEYAGIYRQCNE